MLTRILRWALVSLVALTALVWIAGEVRIQRVNPPERFTGTILSQEADAVLRRACFDCHSNETRYPWYSYLPVASLMLSQHVREGREELNFSRWGQMSAEDRAEAVEESLETVEYGSMPTWDYRLLHPNARLTAADLAALRQAAAISFGAGIGQEKKDGQKGKNRGKERPGKGGEKDDD